MKIFNNNQTSFINFNDMMMLYQEFTNMKKNDFDSKYKLEEGDILYGYGSPYSQISTPFISNGYKMGVFHKLEISGNTTSNRLIGYIFFGVNKKVYLKNNDSIQYKGNKIKLYRKTTDADVNEINLKSSLTESIQKEEANRALKQQSAAQAPAAPATSPTPAANGTPAATSQTPTAVTSGGGTKRKRRRNKKTKRRYKSKRRN
jgi:hypothetical protein